MNTLTGVVRILLLAICPFLAMAQVSDDFSDGDYSNNPTWSGTPDAWTINNFQLRSSTTGTVSPFYLSTSSALTAGIWRSYFRYASLIPTSGNHAEYWVMADNEDLSLAQNGYFIRIGDTDKDICLYKSVNGVSSKIIDGPNQIIASASNSGFVRLTRTAGGQFSLWAIKINGSSDSLLMGTTTDAEIDSSSHLGVLVKSTASNFGKQYFDDFLAVGPAFVDLVPPTLLSAVLVNPSEIDLNFDEALDENFSVQLTNYFIAPAIPILSATLSPNQKTVRLLLSQAFAVGVPYTVEVQNSKDTLGNVQIVLQYKVLTYNPDVPYRSIVINELMVAPLSTATTTVPQVEWIELHNPGTTSITMNGWKIGDASLLPPKNIPLTTIQPGGFVVLVNGTSSSLFPGIPLATMVVPTLNNDLDSIVLYDSNGNSVDIVSYTDSWYKDPIKKLGGYSLEMIQPKVLCTVKENWIGANGPAGGSPGAQNTVYSPIIDLEGPLIQSVSFISATMMDVKFSKAVDPVFCTLIQWYSLNPATATVVSAEPHPTDSTKVRLILFSELTGGQDYILTVQQAKDRFCNVKGSQQFNFTYSPLSVGAELALGNSWKVYPNPFHDGITFSSQNQGVDKNDIEVSVFNSLGQKMMLEWDSETATASTTSLQSGIYFYRITKNEGREIGFGKLIKK